MIGKPTHGARQTSGRVAALSVALAFAALTGFPRAGFPGAFGQCQYEVTAIIEGPPCPPFGDSPPLIGRGLNLHGDVVGRYAACPGCGTSCYDSAIFWSEETGLIPLPKPEGVTTMRANDINDHRQIVGEALIPSVAWLGFMYDMNTGEFEFLEPAIEFGQAFANAINNNGIVAGSRSTKATGTNNYNAVIWDTNTGEVVDLGVMNGPNSNGRGVNDVNQIVGWTGQSITSNAIGFSSADDKIMILGPIPGGDTSRCNSVSPSGIVLGSGHISGKSGTNIHAFLWREQWLDILPPPPGFQHIGGGDLNGVGQRVLTATSPSSPDQPFLWQQDKLLNLNTLTPALGGGRSAMAINDNGQILLRLGDTRAVLITPADIPFADLNFDCNVNEYDLLILLGAFGPQPGAAGSGGGSPHPADLNGDGVVNVSDLLIMLGNWNP